MEYRYSSVFHIWKHVWNACNGFIYVLTTKPTNYQLDVNIYSHQHYLLDSDMDYDINADMELDSDMDYDIWNWILIWIMISTLIWNIMIWFLVYNDMDIMI